VNRRSILELPLYCGPLSVEVRSEGSRLELELPSQAFDIDVMRGLPLQEPGEGFGRTHPLREGLERDRFGLDRSPERSCERLGEVVESIGSGGQLDRLVGVLCPDRKASIDLLRTPDDAVLWGGSARYRDRISLLADPPASANLYPGPWLNKGYERHRGFLAGGR
jgi:hypothetical protein